MAAAEAINVTGVITQVIGGLAIFLMGMKNMSEGLQAVAGDRLRKMIGAVTNNRMLAVFIGTAVTCLVQSSSVTTVMVIGFVNAGIMTLMQAIGVIFGANIGTTITGWLVAGLPIGKWGLSILGGAGFFYLFSKKDRIRYLAMAIMGIGMVFYGLELMKHGFKPLAASEGFRNWFSVFDATSGYFGVLKCAFLGCILTMIVQSSSATLVITMTFAALGIISFPTAAALVLGENIGTTITAYLASLGASTTAKRAAWAHILFNVIGVLWITMIFRWYYPLINSFVEANGTALAGFVKVKASISEDAVDPLIGIKIAMIHTGFNVINTILFVPLIGIIAKLVTRIVPDKKEKEVNHLTYLDVRMLDTPALGIVQSKEQLNFMADSVEGMMEKLRTTLEDGTSKNDLADKIFHREEILDNVQKEIFMFLSNMVSGQVPHEITIEAHKQMRVADEYESLSDYVTNVLKGIKKMEQNTLPLEGPSQEKLIALHDRVANYITRLNKSMKAGSGDDLAWATTEGAAIAEMMKELRRQHLERLQKEEVSPFFSLAYTDMLNFYRRMKDHALNIAEVVSGEK